MPFIYKVHKQGKDTLLAFADSDLKGKTLKQGELEVEISPSFYGEHVTDAGTVIKLTKEATIVNAVGKVAIDLLVTQGLVSPEETVEIASVPHAQIFLLI